MSALPSYSDASAPPAYSSDPSTEEQTLQLTPRSARHLSSSTTCTKSAGNTSLVLKNWATHHGHPCYSQNTLIEGSVILERPEDLRQVSIKLKGCMKTSVHQSSPKTLTLLDESHTLWDDSSEKSCPRSIPFTIAFPSAFQHNGETVSLPPSYQLDNPGFDGCTASVSYSLVVTVHQKSSRLTTWLNTKKLIVPLHYSPRSRPARPILASSNDIVAMKSRPEEWHQSLTEVKARKSDVPSLYCHFFLPDGRAYSLSDVIPFHLQVSGPLQSLKLLCEKMSNGFTPSISLLRQVVVNARGVKVIHNACIGESQVKPMPPSAFSVGEDLDWEGKLHCDSDVSTAGFEAPGVVVKDFISISFSDFHSEKSPFRPFQVVIPIRLTSESWHDEAGYG